LPWLPQPTLFAFALSITISSTFVPLKREPSSLFSKTIISSPFDINYNVLPYFAANMTFSLAKPNVPSCQSSITGDGWFSGINLDGNCATVTSEPVFNYTGSIFYDISIKIHV